VSAYRRIGLVSKSSSLCLFIKTDGKSWSFLEFRG
jgi:hypothetical protein